MSDQIEKTTYTALIDRVINDFDSIYTQFAAKKVVESKGSTTVLNKDSLIPTS